MNLFLASILLLLGILVFLEAHTSRKLFTLLRESHPDIWAHLSRPRALDRTRRTGRIDFIFKKEYRRVNDADVVLYGNRVRILDISILLVLGLFVLSIVVLRT